CAAVELERGSLDAALLVAREGAPAGRLREPALAGRVEARGGGVCLPGDGHAASVSSVAFTVGAVPGRVLAGLIGQVDDLGQAELLALVDVGAAGERKHERGGSAGAAQPNDRVRQALRLRAEAVALRVFRR